MYNSVSFGVTDQYFSTDLEIRKMLNNPDEVKIVQSVDSSVQTILAKLALLYSSSISCYKKKSTKSQTPYKYNYYCINKQSNVI